MTTTQTIKKFFEPIFVDLGSFVICGCIALLGSIHSLSYAWYLQKLSLAIETNNRAMFSFRCYIFLGTVIGWFVVRLFDRKYYFLARAQADNYIHKTYMQKFFYADNSKVEHIGTAKVISIIKTGAQHRSFRIADVFWFYLGNIFTIIISLGIIGSRSSAFLGLSIFILIFIIGWLKYITPYSLKYRKGMKESLLDIDRHLTRQIHSKFEILQNDKISHEYDIYKRFSDQIVNFRGGEKFWQAIGYDGANLCVGLLRLGVLAYIGYSIFHQSANISDFVLYISLTAILVSTVGEFAKTGREFSDSLIHIDKFRELFDTIQTKTTSTTGDVFNVTNGAVEIRDISYGYSKESLIFSDFNLTFMAKKKTALVGPSGGGKSTLIKIIAGYISPNDGKVTVDKQNLATTNLISYYRHIGYLTQDPSVFDGTIRENLLYGLPTPTPPSEGGNFQSQLDNIITAACCQFIYDMPNGLDTEIGERGIRLSGGQKQRLAIAKIMLKNPSIILLDEPTSALDSHNEQQVTIALNNLFHNKTVIVIAHRLQTVKHADEIIYIADGKIVERGTHEQLLALGGAYATMVELQSGF